MKESLIRTDDIEEQILLVRGQKVILDVDLAGLYGVSVKALNQAVKRNRERFPGDFMFRLSRDEIDSIKARRSQFVTFYSFQYLTHHPYAFTEQGVAMLSSVLRSKRAVQVNIEIMRAFVRMRSLVAQSKDLSHKLAELESRIGTHDKAIRSLFDAIRQLMKPPKKEKKPVGFVSTD